MDGLASVTQTRQSLCDLSAIKSHNDLRGRRGFATRFCSWSATGRRLIMYWLPTDRGLVGDLLGSSLRLDATGRRPVRDRSSTYQIGCLPSQFKIMIKKKNIDTCSIFETDEFNMVHILSLTNFACI